MSERRKRFWRHSFPATAPVDAEKAFRVIATGDRYLLIGPQGLIWHESGSRSSLENKATNYERAYRLGQMTAALADDDAATEAKVA